MILLYHLFKAQVEYFQPATLEYNPGDTTAKHAWEQCACAMQWGVRQKRMPEQQLEFWQEIIETAPDGMMTAANLLLKGQSVPTE